MNRTTQFLYICHFISSPFTGARQCRLKSFAKFTLFLEPIFNKAADLQSPVYNFIKKETEAFPKGFAKFEICKNIFLIEQLCVTVSTTFTFLNYDF